MVFKRLSRSIERVRGEDRLACAVVAVRLGNNSTGGGGGSGANGPDTKTYVTDAEAREMSATFDSKMFDFSMADLKDVKVPDIL